MKAPLLPIVFAMRAIGRRELQEVSDHRYGFMYILPCEYLLVAHSFLRNCTGGCLARVVQVFTGIRGDLSMIKYDTEIGALQARKSKATLCVRLSALFSSYAVNPKQN